jgi:hypothetical protein
VQARKRDPAGTPAEARVRGGLTAR